MIALFKRFGWLFLGIFLTCAGATATAAVTTTQYGPFSVSCSGGVQLCNNVFSQVVTTAGTLQVQYNASAGHCSNVRVNILVDGVPKAVTAFLAPGQASGFFNVGPVSAGAHTVAVQGEGTVGGCNSGSLANWGGTIDVTTDAGAIAAADVPTLDGAMLVVLAALLAAVAWRARRS